MIIIYFRKRLNINERQIEILKKLSDNEFLSVAKLAKLFDVSQVTIRNDLNSLENLGLLKRRHGGASVDDISQRLLINLDIKLEIAKYAANMVKDGNTIMVESGSTNALFVRHLGEHKKAVIITNSYYIAHFSKDLPNLEFILLGGNFQKEAEISVGPLTEISLENFFVDKLFIGIDGIDEQTGFMGMDLRRSQTVSAMSKRAQSTIILTDSSKFERKSITQILPFSSVDEIITDKNISPKIEKILKSYHIKIHKV